MENISEEMFNEEDISKEIEEYKKPSDRTFDQYKKWYEVNNSKELIDRNEIFSAIKTKIDAAIEFTSDKNYTSILSIYGDGGVGKSEICTKIENEYEHLNPLTIKLDDNSVFTGDLSSGGKPGAEMGLQFINLIAQHICGTDPEFFKAYIAEYQIYCRYYGNKNSDSFDDGLRNKVRNLLENANAASDYISLLIDTPEFRAINFGLKTIGLIFNSLSNSDKQKLNEKLDNFIKNKADKDTMLDGLKHEFISSMKEYHKKNPIVPLIIIDNAESIKELFSEKSQNYVFELFKELPFITWVYSGREIIFKTYSKENLVSNKIKVYELDGPIEGLNAEKTQELFNINHIYIDGKDFPYSFANKIYKSVGGNLMWTILLMQAIKKMAYDKNDFLSIEELYSIKLDKKEIIERLVGRKSGGNIDKNILLFGFVPYASIDLYDEIINENKVFDAISDNNRPWYLKRIDKDYEVHSILAYSLQEYIKEQLLEENGDEYGDYNKLLNAIKDTLYNAYQNKKIDTCEIVLGRFLSTYCEYEECIKVLSNLNISKEENADKYISFISTFVRYKVDLNLYLEAKKLKITSYKTEVQYIQKLIESFTKLSADKLVYLSDNFNKEHNYINFYFRRIIYEFCSSLKEIKRKEQIDVCVKRCSDFIYKTIENMEIEYEISENENALFVIKELYDCIRILFRDFLHDKDQLLYSLNIIENKIDSTDNTKAIISLAKIEQIMIRDFYKKYRNELYVKLNESYEHISGKVIRNSTEVSKEYLDLLIFYGQTYNKTGNILESKDVMFKAIDILKTLTSNSDGYETYNDELNDIHKWFMSSASGTAYNEKLKEIENSIIDQLKSDKENVFNKKIDRIFRYVLDVYYKNDFYMGYLYFFYSACIAVNNDVKDIKKLINRDINYLVPVYLGLYKGQLETISRYYENNKTIDVVEDDQKYESKKEKIDCFEKFNKLTDVIIEDEMNFDRIKAIRTLSLIKYCRNECGISNEIIDSYDINGLLWRRGINSNKITYFSDLTSETYALEVMASNMDIGFINSLEYEKLYKDAQIDRVIDSLNKTNYSKNKPYTDGELKNIIRKIITFDLLCSFLSAITATTKALKLEKLKPVLDKVLSHSLKFSYYDDSIDDALEDMYYGRKWLGNQYLCLDIDKTLKSCVKKIKNELGTFQNSVDYEAWLKNISFKKKNKIKLKDLFINSFYNLFLSFMLNKFNNHCQHFNESNIFVSRYKAIIMEIMDSLRIITRKDVNSNSFQYPVFRTEYITNYINENKPNKKNEILYFELFGMLGDFALCSEKGQEIYDLISRTLEENKIQMTNIQKYSVYWALSKIESDILNNLELSKENKINAINCLKSELKSTDNDIIREMLISRYKKMDACFTNEQELIGYYKKEKDELSKIDKDEARNICLSLESLISRDDEVWSSLDYE